MSIKKSEEESVDLKPVPIDPKYIRKKIAELESRLFLIQTAYGAEGNLLKRNRMINLMDAMNAKKQQLYYMLHEMEERGKIKEEVEQKRLVAWQEFVKNCKKAGECPQHKNTVDDECYTSGCEDLIIKLPKEPEKFIGLLPKEITDEGVAVLMEQKKKEFEQEILKTAEEHICPECEEK
jgi:hypothetical protein